MAMKKVRRRQWSLLLGPVSGSYRYMLAILRFGVHPVLKYNGNIDGDGDGDGVRIAIEPRSSRDVSSMDI